MVQARRMGQAGAMTDELTRFLWSAMPLCEVLGIRGVEMSPERVVLHLDWAQSLCTAAGQLHGGALMALADSAGGACAYANLPEGAGTSTIESKTNLLGAVREGTVTAVATPLHVGSTTMVIETEVRRADGRLVSKTTQTQAVLRARD
jgi:uncharacterized protein (TIGR00369 family)